LLRLRPCPAAEFRHAPRWPGLLQGLRAEGKKGLMGAVERIEREMLIMAEDCGYDPQTPLQSGQALQLYVEALESLLTTTAEQLQQCQTQRQRPEREMGDQPKTRKADQAHVRETALRNAPRRGSQRDLIVRQLWRSAVPRTAEQLADSTGIPLNSVSTRMSELLVGGWVEERGTARTQHGGRATIYRLTLKGGDWCAQQTDRGAG
jgi:hypothetical protein